MNEQVRIIQKLDAPLWIIVFSLPNDLTSDVLKSDLLQIDCPERLILGPDRHGPRANPKEGDASQGPFHALSLSFRRSPRG